MIAELQTAISNVPKRKERLQGLTQVEAVRIKVERAALLFRGAPIAIAVTLLNALITIAVVWGDIEKGSLLAWGGAIILLCFIRFGIWLRYKMSGVSGRRMSRFARMHIFFMAVNGAMWGALAPLFAVHGMLDHAFLPFVIAGTAAGAIVSAGASWRAVVSFNIPALLPLATVYALMVGSDGIAIASVVFLYGAATIYLAFATQKMIDRSILLHSKNEKLFSALQRQVNEAHVAEQRFRALVESSMDLTIIFSPSGKITYVSPSAEKSLGVPASEMIGMTTKDIVEPEDLGLFRAVGEKSLSNLGEVIALPHVCIRGNKLGSYIALGGRLTNMLYVPGVEGFVFSGGRLDDQAAAEHEHAEAHL